ncbi:PREDICTED: heat shock factor protein 1-like isoform X2 [Ceratosolen solmsi marchali]|uniref:Heat shock factor protein 1-like isoform X2 n=1 Tax=Ceratosolen solmsi marchali TaxID=326594 RepID=A0AAJ7DTM3_9HYME|nr:PREDICTED: heat shock factor protein 1-like isoform X2 [Ceratosolen solmsi marchali]
MHTISEMGTSVPAFLGKLWRLVEDPETDDLICWSPNGRSFFIRNQARFARELLPHYYKHNNMASFVRQLNMYGFHKKVSVELGGLKCDRDEMEFAHQYFCKDHPYLLDHIKRKIASNKTQDTSQAPIKPELMNRMLTEVRSIRGRQEHFDSRLGAMKRENEALWRELALLRQKHHKQQQIVNKLIHFLVSLVQPNRSSGLSMKRRYPLMIDDSSRQRIRQSKISKLQQSPIGPAIHELDSSDPDLDSDYIVPEMLDSDQTPTIESPDHHSIAEDNMGEYTDESIQLPHEVKICQNTNVSKKRFKGKKKGRKNKVPIKILIPSSEKGEETREETLMLEVQLNKVKAVPVVTTSTSLTTATISKPTSLKPVPMATVRSSKLAAMAANMKKNQEVELDLDLNSYEENENEESKDDSLIKLENILIVPGITNEDYNSELGENNDNTIPSSVSSLSGNSTNNGSPCAEENSPEASDLDNGTFGNIDFMSESSISQIKSPSASKQIEAKHMSLSRVNPGSISESNYRLGSMEEVDTHLDTMQSELDNLREILRGEGYSIDANTLLGLFGAEDPMSFGIPVNPDLDPHSNQEKESDDDHHMNAEQCGSSNKGELMAYNATPSLLDFDDDIFLGASSSPVPVVTDVSNTGLSNDPLELTENKANIFDSLIAANNTNSSQS